MKIVAVKKILKANDQLAEENNPSSTQASSLVELGSKTHNQIRHIARMLFPVQILAIMELSLLLWLA